MPSTIIRDSIPCNSALWGSQAGDCGTGTNLRQIAPPGSLEKKLLTPKVEAKKLKRGLLKRSLAKRDQKSLSSSEFCDVLDVNYIVPSTRNHRTKRNESSNDSAILSIFISIMQKIDIVKEKVD